MKKKKKATATTNKLDVIGYWLSKNDRLLFQSSSPFHLFGLKGGVAAQAGVLSPTCQWLPTLGSSPKSCLHSPAKRDRQPKGKMCCSPVHLWIGPALEGVHGINHGEVAEGLETRFGSPHPALFMGTDTCIPVRGCTQPHVCFYTTQSGFSKAELFFSGWSLDIFNVMSMLAKNLITNFFFAANMTLFDASAPVAPNTTNISLVSGFACSMGKIGVWQQGSSSKGLLHPGNGACCLGVNSGEIQALH